jgi:hypothetical protein
MENRKRIMRRNENFWPEGGAELRKYKEKDAVKGEVI